MCNKQGALHEGEVGMEAGEALYCTTYSLNPELYLLQI
jgi:hypothetical protein